MPCVMHVLCTSSWSCHCFLMYVYSTWNACLDTVNTAVLSRPMQQVSLYSSEHENACLIT